MRFFYYTISHWFFQYKINLIFPKTKNQLCIVHQIRSSCKFVPYKDRKEVCADLKKIYGAVNLDDAEYAKEEFREKWDRKYPNILKSWDKNWSELTAFFEYSQNNIYDECCRSVP